MFKIIFEPFVVKNKIFEHIRFKQLHSYSPKNRRTMKNKRQGYFLPKTGVILFTFLFCNLAEAQQLIELSGIIRNTGTQRGLIR
jgi:hypothetical protein